MQLRSLRARLVLLFFAVVALAAVVFAVVAVRQFNAHERDMSRDQLQRQARGFADFFAAQQQARTGLSDKQGAKRVDTPAALKRAIGADIYYAPRFRGLRFGTTRTGLARFPEKLRPLLSWAVLARGQTQTFDIRIGDKPYLAVAAPTTFRAPGPGTASRNVIGALVLAKPRTSLSSSALAQADRLLPSLALAVVIALLLAVFLGRRITRPVRDLTDASERVARGDYDVVLNAKGGDELGLLARRFEEMAARLKESSQTERNFLMRISHELRTPLTAIQGHVQALADEIIDDPDERAASLEVVLSETDRLQRLIGDLLDLAKLEARRFSLNREQVDVEALATLAVQGRREVARASDVQLGFRSFGPLVVDGDGDRILQIVANLLDNALRWTPPGGVVELSVAREASRARIAVADSGPGVPDGQREAIFRPFVSHDDTGTGLGLSVASELAVAMGGRLAVEDRPGGGAVFVLRLPLASGVAAGDGTRPRTVAPA
jgi:signal transduction histidine kinase